MNTTPWMRSPLVDATQPAQTLALPVTSANLALDRALTWADAATGATSPTPRASAMTAALATNAARYPHQSAARPPRNGPIAMAP